MIKSYPFRIETNGQMKKLFILELQYKIGGEKVSRSERSPYSHDTRLLRTHTTLKRVGGSAKSVYERLASEDQRPVSVFTNE